MERDRGISDARRWKKRTDDQFCFNEALLTYSLIFFSVDDGGATIAMSKKTRRTHGQYHSLMEEDSQTDSREKDKWTDGVLWKTDRHSMRVEHEN